MHPCSNKSLFASEVQPDTRCWHRAGRGGGGGGGAYPVVAAIIYSMTFKSSLGIASTDGIWILYECLQQGNRGVAKGYCHFEDSKAMPRTAALGVALQ